MTPRAVDTVVQRALVERVLRHATRVGDALPGDVVRRRLADHSTAPETACAFEAAVGGLRIRTCELGIDTHRRHPPRDAYDEWLDPVFQRELLQIAYESEHHTTYWLDRRGWVHAIAPLDRLRLHAESLEEFLLGLTGSLVRSPQRGVVAFGGCSANDADALFGAAPGCPVGAGVVRWPEDAMDGLEERAWLESALAQPHVVLSAPDLSFLAEQLAEYVALEPAADIALLDAEPWPAYDNPIVDVAAQHTYRLPWHEHRLEFVVGRDRHGQWCVARR